MDVLDRSFGGHEIGRRRTISEFIRDRSVKQLSEPPRHAARAPGPPFGKPRAKRVKSPLDGVERLQRMSLLPPDAEARILEHMGVQILLIESGPWKAQKGFAQVQTLADHVVAGVRYGITGAGEIIREPVGVMPPEQKIAFLRLVVMAIDDISAPAPAKGPAHPVCRFAAQINERMIAGPRRHAEDFGPNDGGKHFRLPPPPARGLHERHDKIARGRHAKGAQADLEQGLPHESAGRRAVAAIGDEVLPVDADAGQAGPPGGERNEIFEVRDDQIRRKVPDDGDQPFDHATLVPERARRLRQRGGKIEPVAANDGSGHGHGHRVEPEATQRIDQFAAHKQDFVAPQRLGNGAGAGEMAAGVRLNAIKDPGHETGISKDGGRGKLRPFKHKGLV